MGNRKCLQINRKKSAALVENWIQAIGRRGGCERWHTLEEMLNSIHSQRKCKLIPQKITLHLLAWQKNQKLVDASSWQERKGIEPLCQPQGGKPGSPLWSTVWPSSAK